MKYVSKSLEETATLASFFLDTLKMGEKAVVVGLFGDLGAGKTAFVKKCAEHFGIDETIISPTFIIEKIYKLPAKTKNFWKHMVHIDAYRLENADELRHLGFEELRNDPQNIIFIEWPERILEKLPKDIKKIYFEFVDENTREINM